MENDRILLNKNWLFALTDDENAVLKEYDDAAFRRITLPHDWQAENARRKVESDMPQASASSDAVGRMPASSRSPSRISAEEMA